MAKEAKTLDDLFHDTLKDIYYAEKKNSCDAAKAGEGGAERRAQGCVRKARS